MRLLIFLILFSLVGCASSPQWKSQTNALSPEGPMGCLLVVGVDPDGNQARRFEAAFRQSMASSKIDTLTSASIGEFPKLDQLNAFIEKNGVHYVLVTQLVNVNDYETPVTGDTNLSVHFGTDDSRVVQANEVFGIEGPLVEKSIQHQDYSFEIRLFDAETKTLAWSGLMNVHDPENRDEALRLTVKETLSRMSSLGFM